MVHCRQADYSDAVTEEMARLIAAATTQAEEMSQRALITQSWELTLARWPADSVIRLPRPPLASVTSIQYVDLGGTTQTWDSTNYQVNTSAEPGRVTLAYSKTFPSIRNQDEAVTIAYTAGYGAAHTDVPALIRQAILSMVVHWYDYRGEILAGTIQSKLPMGAETILMQQRIHQ